MSDYGDQPHPNRISVAPQALSEVREAMREAREHLTGLWKVQILAGYKNDAAMTLTVLHKLDAALAATT
jgi:hypothetical protein